MAHGLTFHIVLATCLTAVCFTVKTEAVTCYECMWIKGRTDDDCFKLPQERRSGPESYLVDCNEYSDEHGKYTHCETAIGCLDRGFGKRPSLHRACSLGAVSNRDADLLADAPRGSETSGGNSTENGTTSSAESSKTTTSATTEHASESRRRRQAPGNDSQSDEHDGAEDESEGSSSDPECYNLGDGETADGAGITNLTVCFCDADNCNIHSNKSVLEMQKKFADFVCNGSNGKTFVAIFALIVAAFVM